MSSAWAAVSCCTLSHAFQPFDFEVPFDYLLQEALAEMASLCSVNDEADPGPIREGPEPPCLAAVEASWVALCCQLFSERGSVRQAQLEQAAKDPRLITTLHKVSLHGGHCLGA